MPPWLEQLIIQALVQVLQNLLGPHVPPPPAPPK
jgi:hypothetical protein